MFPVPVVGQGHESQPTALYMYLYNPVLGIVLCVCFLCLWSGQGPESQPAALSQSFVFDFILCGLCVLSF